MATPHVLRFPGTTDGLERAVGRLRALLDARALHPRHRHDIELVFEEIASNIVNYGRPTRPVKASVRFGGETILTFEDAGIPFDPRAHPAPPEATRRADLRIGGLGLVIVRDLCARFDYERTPDGRNRVTLAIVVPVPDLDPTGEMPATRP